MKILFICRGNVGRSQMAAAIFNKITGGKHDVISAGTWVYSKEGESRDGQLMKNLPGAEKVIDSLKEKSIDISENKRTQLTPELLSTAEKVIVMAESNTIPDYLRDKEGILYWEVADPKEMDIEGTNRIRDEIEARVTAFASTL